MVGYKSYSQDYKWLETFIYPLYRALRVTFIYYGSYKYIATLVEVTVTHNYCVSVSLMVKPVKRFNALGDENVL